MERALKSNLLHSAPSIEEPDAKKRKDGGRNPDGSKGTYKCARCRKRKGRCDFDPMYPLRPCDHCLKRRLPCGPKLLTENKIKQILASSGDLPPKRPISAPLPSIAPRPVLSPPQLRLQIPPTRSIAEIEPCDLDVPSSSSAVMLPSPIASQPHSAVAGLSQTMDYLSLDMRFPSDDERSDRSAGFCTTSPQLSTPMTPPPPITSMDELEFLLPSDNVQRFPSNHVAHALNLNVLQFIGSALPSFPNSPVEEPASDIEVTGFDADDLWLTYQQEYLCFDECEPDTNEMWPRNRLGRMPSHTFGRKLAGIWPDFFNKSQEKKEKSIHSAPSIF